MSTFEKVRLPPASVARVSRMAGRAMIGPLECQELVNRLERCRIMRANPKLRSARPVRSRVGDRACSAGHLRGTGNGLRMHEER